MFARRKMTHAERPAPEDDFTHERATDHAGEGVKCPHDPMPLPNAKAAHAKLRSARNQALRFTPFAASRDLVLKGTLLG